MKQVVSVSLGEAARDKTVTVTLAGHRVRLERRGADGDMARAAAWLSALDGQVDALGLGGADFGLRVDDRWYPLHGVRPLSQAVRLTPFTDGTGLKNTLEADVAQAVEPLLGNAPRRVFVVMGGDRWGMTRAFTEAGYTCVFGDAMFALGLPWPLHSVAALKRAYRWLAPLAMRLPFSWLYPTGAAQRRWQPKFTQWYDWASVIAGDCHYIKKHRPARLTGKIIVTNTTTPEDVALFRQAGVAWLITSTPVLEGRSFGTNVLEAALIALSGQARRLSEAELRVWIAQVGWQPGRVRLSALG